MDVALPLGELGAVRVHDEGEVRELRGVPPQRLVQQQVLWRRNLCLMRIQLNALARQDYSLKATLIQAKPEC